MITVFTPTYNRAYTLVDLYESLLHQTCFDFEWLIVDDGSTDETEEFVKDWLDNGKFDVRYFKKLNGGKPSAINYGLQLAQGEYFWIIDSDDTATLNGVETCLKWIESLPEGAKFAATMNDFVEKVASLGENKRLEDLRCKQ